MVFASMVSVEMGHVGNDNTGEVESGVLTLVGPCARVQVGQKSQFVKRDKAIEEFRSPDDPYRVKKYDGMPDMTARFDTRNDVVDEALVIWVKARAAGMGRWWNSGLALRCVEKNKFQRLGLVSGYFDSKDDARGLIEWFPRKQVNIV
ncbi:uncharacterized protein HRG_11274 [Hirsutella rhossiliensis]|uniref:Uncharacterized protein n=1 Tax=Hirsutella rhossiliensis TaxID=111463 RepID=A0A9P8SCM2_9HYPO|nr:uncharacterized protein HRG_11274 [Hirsutella rhossiliensis]KAH0957783.1 hypothetical protein HRG_11274 [Hirsutella rhossiliensis]